MSMFPKLLPLTLVLAGVCTFANAAKPALTDLNYCPSYGQSLSVGWTGVPVVSTEQKEGNLMFKSGVRVHENGNDRSELIPLVESVNGPRGETPITGAITYFTRALKKEDPALAAKVRFIGSAQGVGGISVNGLVKGSGAYHRIIEDLTAGKAIATKEKKKFSMPCFVWTQGETDQQDKKTKEWYKEKMLKLIDDIDADAKAITGQRNDVLCFGYQVSSHLHYFNRNPTDFPVIAQAQLEMALEKKNRYIMTTPMYHFEYSDGVHLSAPMSRLYGEYTGYVMKKVMIDGVDWRPMHPTARKIKKSGKEWIIEVQFFVPEPPLVLDTKTILDPGNFGFSLVTKQGAPQSIKSVSLTGKNIVRIVTEDDPTRSKLRYGMTLKKLLRTGPKTGARGCLRDSQGDKVKTKILKTVYRMDNWCPFFEISLDGKMW